MSRGRPLRGTRCATSLLAALAPLAMALGGCAAPGTDRLARFAATLAARDSATAALEAWCAERGLAAPPRVTAAVLAGPAPAEPAEARGLLGVAPATPLGFRHVTLSCGGRVLSVARNWYVPDRLTPGMNAALATSDVPFGKVAAPLGYRRERLGTLPRGTRDCPRGTVLGHRALLRLPGGQPLALLVECYTGANLAR